MPNKEIETAYLRIVRFIQYRPRSRFEIERKMKMLKFPTDIVQKLLERLENESLIDDEAFAKSWAESKVYSQCYGRIKVRGDLISKGINKITVDKILEDVYNDESELELAIRWLNRKYLHNDERDELKMIQALMRHGFEYSLSKDAVHQFSEQ